MNNVFKKKKDFRCTKFRVIIWGRNEYNGSVICNAKSFSDFDEDPNFYFENGLIHYHHQFDPNGSFRYFKHMSRHYVFDLNGNCVSHPKKKYIRNKIFDVLPGLPYAELKFLI